MQIGFAFAAAVRVLYDCSCRCLSFVISFAMQQDGCLDSTQRARLLRAAAETSEDQAARAVQALQQVRVARAYYARPHRALVKYGGTVLGLTGFRSSVGSAG